jgi:glutamine amidotransferase
MKKIAIVDFGLGNLFSVLQVCQKLEMNAFVTSDAKKIADCHGIILPGVGAFGDAVTNLQKLELLNFLKDEAQRGKNIFGICLGMQILFERGYEFGTHEGLKLIKGDVLKFDQSMSPRKKMRVPQIAWNTIHGELKDPWIKSPLKTLKEGDFMYFVHSFYVEPTDAEVIASTTKYCGFKYCSSILKDNIFAVQFHPEKSGLKGLEIYKNWYQKVCEE